MAEICGAVDPQDASHVCTMQDDRRNHPVWHYHRPSKVSWTDPKRLSAKTISAGGEEGAKELGNKARNGSKGSSEPSPEPAPTPEPEPTPPPLDVPAEPHPLFPNWPGKMHSEPRATEQAAAQAVLPKTGTQRWQVYEAILATGDVGLTDEEIQTVLSMGSSSERPRRVELVESNLIEDSGAVRPGASGLDATVWTARKPRPPHASD